MALVDELHSAPILDSVAPQLLSIPSTQNQNHKSLIVEMIDFVSLHVYETLIIVGINNIPRLEDDSSEEASRLLEEELRAYQ